MGKNSLKEPRVQYKMNILQNVPIYSQQAYFFKMYRFILNKLINSKNIFNFF